MAAAKAFTTKQEKIGDRYTEVLIIAESIQKAKIVEHVASTPMLDGWIQIREEDQAGNRIERYPIINQLN